MSANAAAQILELARSLTTSENKAYLLFQKWMTNPRDPSPDINKVWQALAGEYGVPVWMTAEEIRAQAAEKEHSAYEALVEHARNLAQAFLLGQSQKEDRDFVTRISHELMRYWANSYPDELTAELAKRILA